MNAVEWLQAKLSLDTSDLSRGKRDIAEFADHGHKSFLHAGSAARSFHGILEKITEQSPVMGNALKFALSPVVGILAGAGAAFGFAKDKLAELNKVMDAVGKANRGTLGDMVKVIKDAHNETLKEREQFAAVMAEIEDPLRAINEQLATEQDLLKRNYQIAKERRDLEKSAAIDAVKGRVQAGTMSREAGEKATAAIEQHHATQDRHMSQAEMQDQLRLQQQRLAMMQRVGHDLLADIGDFESPGGEKKRERRRIIIGAATEAIQKAKDDIAQRQAIQEMTREDFEDFEKARAGGKAAQALYALSGAPDRLVKAKQFEEAQRTIDKETSAIAKWTALRDKLAAQDEQERKSHDKKLAGFKEINAEYEKAQGAIQTLSLDLFQSQATAPGTPAAVKPIFDPRTGGYAYRPIEAHGIKYRPLPNSLGYQTPAPAAAPVESEMALRARGMVDAMLQALDGKGNGLPVSIIAVKDDSK